MELQRQTRKNRNKRAADFVSTVETQNLLRQKGSWDRMKKRQEDRKETFEFVPCSPLSLIASHPNHLANVSDAFRAVSCRTTFRCKNMLTVLPSTVHFFSSSSSRNGNFSEPPYANGQVRTGWRTKMLKKRAARLLTCRHFAGVSHARWKRIHEHESTRQRPTSWSFQATSGFLSSRWSLFGDSRGNRK